MILDSGVLYLISLERDMQRRAEFNLRFPSYVSSVVIVDAVDAVTWSAKDYFNELLQVREYKINNRRLPILSPMEIACAKSHMLALGAFLSTEADYAIILEDDVMGDASALNKAHKLCDQFYTQLGERGVLLLGGQNGLNNERLIYGKPLSQSVFKLADNTKQFIYRTCCYAVDRESAKRILTLQKEGLILADGWGELAKDLPLYFSHFLDHPESQLDGHIGVERDSLNSDFKRITKLQHYWVKLKAKWRKWSLVCLGFITLEKYQSLQAKRK